MATNVDLGNACPFAVLAGTTVTNTGSTVIGGGANGNVGLSPGSAVTGFPPGSVTPPGSIHINDGLANAAQIALTAAYNQAAGLPFTSDLTGQVLGSGGTVPVLTPGVYKFDTSAQLNGALTLSGLGDYVFQIGSTLTTASASSIILAAGAVANRVYWQVGSSATLGTNTAFIGAILALTSITVTTGASINGKALARNGAVTLDTNNITGTVCETSCPIITVDPATLPDGQVGVLYDQTVSAPAGNPPITFTITSGSLPPPLLLNAATGQILGTPNTAGTFIFTITATDVDGCIGTREYIINIASAGCPVITLSPLSLPNNSAGSVYSQTITPSGGTAPYTFAVTSGALPTGTTLNAATGEISGVTLTVGEFNFTITVTDDNGCLGALAYTINVTALCPSIILSPLNLPSGRLNVVYSETITVSAGAAPISFIITSGVLPPGLNLDPITGILSGTPTTQGTFNFTITALDINLCQGSRAYSITVIRRRGGTGAIIGGPKSPWANCHCPEK